MRSCNLNGANLFSFSTHVACLHFSLSYLHFGLQLFSFFQNLCVSAKMPNAGTGVGAGAVTALLELSH